MQNAFQSEFIAQLQQTRAEFSAGADIARVASASRALKRIEAALARPPRLAVFGEFNSGKSSLTNLLIGRCALPESVLTNETGARLLRYAESPCLHAIAGDGRRHKLTKPAYNKLTAPPALTEIGLPYPKLREFEIIDTVGVSDPSQTSTDALLPMAHCYVHAAVWCTLAPQAWKRSEWALWRTVPVRLRRCSVLVVTHIDALVEERDRARVADRLREETAGQFRDLALISLKDALEALGPRGEIIDAERWRQSGADTLLEKLGETIVCAANERCERAVIYARAIAKRLLHGPAPSPDEIAANRLLSLWRYRSDGLDDLTTGGSKSEWIEELVCRARSFGTYSLEPWFDQRIKPQDVRDVLALLPVDAEALESLLGGMDEQEAAAQLTLIMRQVEAELAEVFSGLVVHNHTFSNALPEAIRSAALELAVWKLARGNPPSLQATEGGLADFGLA